MTEKKRSKLMIFFVVGLKVRVGGFPISWSDDYMK